MNLFSHNLLLPLSAALLFSACTEDAHQSVYPSVEDQQLAERCARITACVEFDADATTGLGGLGGFAGVSAEDAQLQHCMRMVYLGLRTGLGGSPGPAPALSCIDQASSCGEVEWCLNAGRSIETCEVDAASGLGGGGECDGDVLRKCFMGVTIAQDCADEGMICSNDGGIGQCVLNEPCEESSCEDGTLRLCTNNQVQEITCLSGACSEEDGTPRCAGTGDPCEPGESYCDGHVGVRCLGGRFDRTECASGICEETSDGPLCRPAAQCERSHCDGEDLVTCLNGVEYTVDCPAIGFNTCAEAPEAACVP